MLYSGAPSASAGAGPQAGFDGTADLGNARLEPQERPDSPSLRDIFYAPFYAKLPYKPGLPPGKGISSLASEERRAREIQRQPTLRTARIHEPFAMLHSRSEPGKVTSQYGRIPMESVGDYKPPAQPLTHVRAQAQNLALAEKAPSTRAALAVKAQLLPAALVDCEADCPTYSFLLRALAATVEKYSSTADDGGAPDATELDVRLCTRQGPAVRFAPAGQSGASPGDPLLTPGDAAGRTSPRSGGNPPAQSEGKPPHSDPTSMTAQFRADDAQDARDAQSSLDAAAEDDAIKYGSDLASLARLVAKREVEAKAYSQRLHGLEDNIREVSKEIEIAKANIKAINLEISRFEAFQQVESEAKAGAAGKLRGEGKYSSGDKATGQLALERLRNADSLELLAK